MTDNIKTLVERHLKLHRDSINDTTRRLLESSADLIEQQAARIAELEARSAKTVAWVRYRSDGGFEGPIMDTDSRMCDTRRSFWTPLYAAPVADSAMAKDAERLSWLIVNIRRHRLYESKGHWFCVPLTAQDWREGHKSAREAIDAAIAASAEKGDKA